MFMGEYSHSVDAKGRLIVPAKFREQLGDQFVVTKGVDGCLYVYSQEEWKRIEEKFREVNLTTKMRVNSCVFSLRVLPCVRWTSRGVS